MPVAHNPTASPDVSTRPVPEPTPVEPPSQRSASKRSCSPEKLTLGTGEDTGRVDNVHETRHKRHACGRHPNLLERRPLVDPPPLDTPSSLGPDGRTFSEMSPWTASSTNVASCPSPSFDEDASFLLAIQDEVHK